MASPFKESNRTDEEQKAFRKEVLQRQRIYFNEPRPFCAFLLLGLLSDDRVKAEEFATHHIVPYRWAEIQGATKEQINNTDNGIPVHWPVHKHRIHPRTHELIKAVGASWGINVTRESHYERVNINCCTKATQDVAAECFEEVMRRAEKTPGLQKTLAKPVRTGQQRDHEAKKWIDTGYRYNQRTRMYEPWTGEAFVYVWEQYQIDHSLKLAHEFDTNGDRVRTLHPGIQIPKAAISIAYPSILNATTVINHEAIAVGRLFKGSGVELFTPVSVAVPAETADMVI